MQKKERGDESEAINIHKSIEKNVDSAIIKEKIEIEDVIKLVKEGEALDKSGKHQEALECYDRAIKINPEDANIWVHKGLALYNVGKFDEAIKCYDRAIAIKPDYLHAKANKEVALNSKKEASVLEWNNKGLALYNQKKYDEAIMSYDRAIAINPNDTYALKNKGNALIELGKYEEAIEYFDRVLKIDPDDAQAKSRKDSIIQKNRHNNKSHSRYKVSILSDFDRDLRSKAKQSDLSESGTKPTSKWDHLLYKNVRSNTNEDIGYVGGTYIDHLSVIGHNNRIYNIPTEKVKAFPGSEAIVNVSFRDLIYYDSTSESRKYVNKNVNLYDLAESIQEYLKQNNFITKFYNDYEPPEIRLHITVMKSGTKFFGLAMKESADLGIRGSSNDFTITIAKNLSVFDATKFIIGGFDKGLWSYITRRIDVLKDTGKK